MSMLPQFFLATISTRAKSSLLLILVVLGRLLMEAVHRASSKC